MKILGLAVLLCLFAIPAYSAVPATITHAAVNVAVTSTSVLAASAATRSLLVLVNDSDVNMYCNIGGAAAVMNQGLRLNAAGGAILLDVSVSQNEVFCIHGGSGSKVLLVVEGK